MSTQNTTTLRHRGPSLAERCKAASSWEIGKRIRAIHRNDGVAEFKAERDSRSYMNLHNKARLMGR